MRVSMRASSVAALWSVAQRMLRLPYGTRIDLPTRTDVRPSSSEALLPPPALLVILNRELLLGAGLTIALSGRGGRFPGDVGGLAIVGAKRGGDPGRYKTSS